MTSGILQALALAQDAENRKFVFEYNNKHYSAGQSVPKDEAAGPPIIKLAGSSEGPYVTICVDLDAPFVSLSILSPIIHWIQPGLHHALSGSLVPQEDALIDWYPAAPPARSGPHRYLAILYEQPNNFDELSAKLNITKPFALRRRFRWDLDDFTKKTGLGAIVSANWFTV